MVAIHFEAQKGKFSKLVFSKITAKTCFFHQLWPNTQKALGPITSGGFIEVNNCPIWCSTAHKLFRSTFVLLFIELKNCAVVLPAKIINGFPYNWLSSNQKVLRQSSSRSQIVINLQDLSFIAQPKGLKDYSVLFFNLSAK